MRLVLVITMIVCIPTATTAISVTTTNQIQASAKGERVSSSQPLIEDVQVTQREINRLEAKRSLWDTITIVCVILAFIAAGGLVITGLILRGVNSNLTAKQHALDADKEALSEADSKNKDIEIGNARRDAGEANKAAGMANRKAEELRKANLTLEAELSPRIFKDQGGAGQTLAAFAPVNAVIEYLPEMECKRTAGQIALTLHDFAHWNVELRANSNESVFFDGLIVQVNAAGVVPENVLRAAKASEALVAELNKTGIEARTHAADLNVAQGIVVIRVGMKPNPALERIVREAEAKRQARIRQ